MKIALVIERFGPSVGDCERNTHQIAKRLFARDHELTIYCNQLIGDPHPLAPARIRTGQIPGIEQRSGLIRFSRWAKHKIHSGQYDLSFSLSTAVDATLIQPSSGTVRGLIQHLTAINPSRSARFIQAVKNRDLTRRLALLQLEKKHFHSPRTRRLIAISQCLADQLHQFYSVPTSRISIIRNGAARPDLTPEEIETTRDETRAMLGLTREHLVYASLSSQPRRQGLPGLLQAFAHLHRYSPHTRLIVTGTLDYSLQALASQLGIAEAILWTGPTREVERIYAAADVVVTASHYDPASPVALEAIRCGRPVIASPTDGACDWLNDPAHDRAGLVLDHSYNLDELTRALRIMLDPDARACFADAARSLAPHLTLDHYVDELETIFTQIIAGPDVAPAGPSGQHTS